MAAKQLLYLSRADVECVARDMAAIFDLLEAHSEKGQGGAEMPTKPGIHTRQDAFIREMSAKIQSLKSA